MNKFTTIFAAGILSVVGTVASAATLALDFETEANGNERGVAGNGTYVLNNANTGFVDVQFYSSNYAYFDSGDAGLGVCKILDNNDQCSPSNDDNVTSGEWLDLHFGVSSNIAGFVFRDADHNILDDDRTLLFAYNHNGWASTTFADLASWSMDGITSIQMAYGGVKAEQFYLSGTVVPLPAGGLLLLTGLGGLAVARRRKS